MQRRTSSTIPFGYSLNESDPQFLKEIPEQLEALNTGGSGGYDDSVASTTMGDTPGSESGTY